VSVKITLALTALLQRAGFADERGHILHGKLRELAKLTGVDHHTLSELCRGRNVSGTKLTTVEKICTGIQPHLGGLSPDQIVKALLGAQQSSLLEEIAQHGLVRFIMGLYVRPSEAGPPRRWIAPNDAEAQMVLVRALSSLPRPPMIETAYVPFHLPAPKKGYLGSDYLEDLRKDKEAARTVWTDLAAWAPGRAAWVLLGSMRTNYVAEHMIAGLFGAAAFDPHDQWRIPLFLSYRDWDHRVQSAFGDFGGKTPDGKKPVPGLYVRGLDGWLSLPWRETGSDAGAVVVQRGPRGQFEGVALFGYSGRASVGVCRLATQPNTRELLGPPYAAVCNERSVGVYACRFDFARSDEPQVIPVPEPILTRAAREPRPCRDVRA
jgi:hypothetical protein